MYRVELKVRLGLLPGTMVPGSQLFLMYRVELKGYIWAGRKPANRVMFLMYRVELKVQ